MIRSRPDLYHRKYRCHPLDRGTSITSNGDWRRILGIRVVEEVRTQNIKSIFDFKQQKLPKSEKSTWNWGLTVSGFGG